MICGALLCHQKASHSFPTIVSYVQVAQFSLTTATFVHDKRAHFYLENPNKYYHAKPLARILPVGQLNDLPKKTYRIHQQPCTDSIFSSSRLFFASNLPTTNL